MIRLFAWVVAISACGFALAAPKLAITEIQYDPSSEESDDQQTEWVEIHNYGNDSVSLKGFALTSGSKAKPHDAKQRFVLGELTIAPGQYLVIGIGSKGCYEEYDLPTMAAYAGESKYAWLTNESDSVAIRDPKGKVIDEVVYESSAPWPVIKGSGSTIQFVAPDGEDEAAANDQAKNWVASNSTNSDHFPKHGRGTPGGPPKEKSGDAAQASEKTEPTTRPTRRRDSRQK